MLTKVISSGLSNLKLRSLGFAMKRTFSVVLASLLISYLLSGFCSAMLSPQATSVAAEHQTSFNHSFQKSFIGETDEHSVAFVENQWNISANLTSGDLMRVLLNPAPDWSNGIFDVNPQLPDGIGALYVDINITGPDGNLTVFEITFGRSVMVNDTLHVFFINITSFSGQGAIDASAYYLNYTNSYSEVGGTIDLNGTYTFTVAKPWPERDSPPASIDIREVDTVSEFRSIIIPLLVIPFTVFIVGIKKSRREFHAHTASLET